MRLKEVLGKVEEAWYDDEDDRSPLPVHVIKADIARRNAANQGLFSPAKQQLGQMLETKVASAWIRSKPEAANYRENFIAVKVGKVDYRDRMSSEVRQLDAWAKQNGISIVQVMGRNTGKLRSIIYRIPV